MVLSSVVGVSVFFGVFVCMFYVCVFLCFSPFFLHLILLSMVHVWFDRFLLGSCYGRFIDGSCRVLYPSLYLPCTFLIPSFIMVLTGIHVSMS